MKSEFNKNGKNRSRRGILLLFFLALLIMPGIQVYSQERPEKEVPVGNKFVRSEFSTTDVTGKYAVIVQVKASDRISKEMRQYLEQTLRIYYLEREPRELAIKKNKTDNEKLVSRNISKVRDDELIFWMDKKMQPDSSKYEISIDVIPRNTKLDPDRFIWTWADAFEAVRPGVIALKEGHQKTKFPYDVIIGIVEFPLREGTAGRVTGCLNVRHPILEQAL
ncbi:MAG: hypothetical protein IPJ40_20155 [Saprospirales bacterium]|nr:hypothetical protein [Saprospirales bacterium]